MKFKALVSLLLMGSSLTCFAQGYKDGIEYFKVGQLENASELLNRNLSTAENKSEAYYYLGCIDIKNGNMEAARANFNKGIADNANFAYNYVGLGALDLKANNVKAAEDQFKTAQAKNKKDPKVAVAIARAYYDANPTTYAKQIEKNIVNAQKWNQKDPDSYILEGDMSADKKNWGDAAGKYEMAFTFDADNTPSYVKYANTYFFVNPDMAISKLAEVLEKNPNSALAQRELAEKYYEHDQWSKAAKQYGEYIQNPNHFKQDESRYAFLLFYGQKYQESYDLAKRIVNDPASDAKTKFYMKRMMLYDLVAQKNYTEAETAAQDLFATPGMKFEAKDYTDYAEALDANGKPAESIAQYEKAIEAAPEKADLLKDLSSAYSSAGEHVKAAEALQKFIDKGDFKANDLFTLSRRYTNVAATATDDATKNAALENALKYATQVNEMVPGDYRILGQMARIQNISDADGKAGKAVQSYQELINLLDASGKPVAENANSYIEAYQYLAKHAFATGDKAGAKAYYQKWLEVDPDNADLRKYVNTLK